MENKIRCSRSVDRVMTVVFYLVAVFFFALLIGFAGKAVRSKGGKLDHGK